MRYALIGKGISFSISKKLHETIHELYRLKATYEVIDVDSIENFDFKEFDGLNVTIPYKEAAYKKMDQVSSIASSLGSINTITNFNNKLFGYNTDYLGFEEMMLHYDVSFKGKDIVILGDGATAKMVNRYSQDANAKSIKFVTRKDDENLSYSDMIAGDILINTTPVGLNDDETLVNEETIDNFSVVIDVLYAPYRTKMLRIAERKGKKIINGLYMLCSQAAHANSIWFDRYIETSRVYEEFKKRYLNIVLIGMMNSGKTTLGELIERRYNIKCFDADKEIEKNENRKISDIFAENGEVAFREIERNTIAELSKRNGITIATGGGVILDPENIRNLRKNGIIIFLNRPLEYMLKNLEKDDRPLLKSKEDFKRIYKERLYFYKDAADYEVDGQDVYEKLLKIMEIWEEL